ncbi:MAG: dihydrolipoyl dehydrogenase [Candidatus Omnitrophica bacterium]|nr:dihydrolipoyl dehydrogenase [Candidatus Omnitrophota bacterium]
MQNIYDYIVIGSGPAGHTSAIIAAKLGLKVCVVEKDANMLGGVCLNEGCIPAKSLYHSAKMFNLLKQAEHVNSPVKAEMMSYVLKSRQAAEQLRKGIAYLFKKNNIDNIIGKAKFIDRDTIKVADKTKEGVVLKGKKILIAAGSNPKSLPGLVFDGKKILASSDLIRIDHVPKKILIVGGGAIGCEFASFFNMLGSDVSILESQGRILPFADEDISRTLETILKKRGVSILTDGVIKKSEIKLDSVQAAILSKGETIMKEYDKLAVCVGRVPFTGELALDKAAVKLDKAGYIEVNGKMQTSAENIFAAGDVVNSPMLAHVASYEGEVAARNAAGEECFADHSCMPNIVYTDVETASVGITAQEAKKNGITVVEGKQFFKANGRAVANGETDGFVKVVVEKDSDKIIGAHIIGENASELIHEFVIAKKIGLTAEQMGAITHGHPTFSETSAEACRVVSGKTIYG